jgi:hypothetical protein
MTLELDRIFHRIPQEGVPTSEEIAKVIPRPDLPIVTSYYSATPDGKIICDGGPGGPFGHGRMNGHIEYILKSIASMGKPDNLVPELGEGVMGLGMTVDTPGEYVRRTRRYGESERRVFYVKPQDGEEFEKQLKDSGVNKVAITIGEDKEGEGKMGKIISLLKPETKFSVFSQPGRITRLIIEI